MISWAIETLIASSLLMLVVLAIRKPVARHFGPHIAYGLWSLPALRMLLPPLPEQVAPAQLHMLPLPLDFELLLAMPLPAVGPAEASTNWPLLLAGLWGVGALMFLAWHIYSYRRFVRSAMDQATQLPRFDRDGVEVCASPAARGPFAAGIFLKTIVLPEDYRRRYESDELRLAIEHEVQHHRRCDMSANFVALVVLALHWWNPIAHFAHRAFRVDQELACDAVVLAGATPAERHAYGSALLKTACDRLPVAACALGAGDDLKRRLTMMKVYRRNPAMARLGSVIATGLVGGGLMLTASNGIAAETSKQVEEQVRTVLAPVVPAIAPMPAPASAAAPAVLPPAVKLAMLGHPHPAEPVPPAPPVSAVPPAPPAPPAPPKFHSEAWIDHAELNREINEAMREAQRDIAEAQREAAAARREAMAEAQEARREAMRAGEEARHEALQARTHALTAAKACAAASHRVSVHVDDHGRRTMVRCQGWSEKEQAEFRRTMIASLQSARANIASMDRRHMPEQAREQALESLDQQLARLRKDK